MKIPWVIPTILLFLGFALSGVGLYLFMVVNIWVAFLVWIVAANLLWIASDWFMEIKE